MRDRRIRYAFLTAVAYSLATVASPNEATALIPKPKTPIELVAESAAIVVGTVLEVDSHAGANRGGDPRTRVKIEVLEALTGSLPNAVLELELPIGSFADGRYLDIPGYPNLNPKETYLLFLRADEWTLAPFVGITQGVLRHVDTEKGPVYVDHRGRVLRAAVANGLTFGEQIADAMDLRIAIAPGGGTMGSSAIADATFAAQRARLGEVVDVDEFASLVVSMAQELGVEARSMPFATEPNERRLKARPVPESGR